MFSYLNDIRNDMIEFSNNLKEESFSIYSNLFSSSDSTSLNPTNPIEKSDATMQEKKKNSNEEERKKKMDPFLIYFQDEEYMIFQSTFLFDPAIHNFSVLKDNVEELEELYAWFVSERMENEKIFWGYYVYRQGRIEREQQQRKEMLSKVESNSTLSLMEPSVELTLDGISITKDNDWLDWS